MIDNQKHIPFSFICLILLLLLSVHVRDGSAKERMKGLVRDRPKMQFEKYGYGKNVFFNFYQQWISPVKGGNKCPMYPSCSQYAKIAFEVMPWYQAYTKSLERLLRCGNELYLYPEVKINGHIKFYDPLLTMESEHRDTTQYYLNDDTDRTNGFADFLYERGEYDRAITEYYRLLYLCPDQSSENYLLKKIGLCYFYKTDFAGYISFLKNNESYFQSDTSLRAELELYLAKSYYNLNKYQQAITTLRWSSIQTNSDLFAEAQFIAAISHARMFDWQKAIEKMQLIRDDSRINPSTEHISRSLKNFPKLPRKSPGLAGTLSSVIPGAGYMYCNRKKTGLISLIVNGLMLWTIRDAVMKKQYGLATAASFFGIGWYIGNIRGSVDAANDYNSGVRHKFIDKLLSIENCDDYLIKL